MMVRTRVNLRFRVRVFFLFVNGEDCIGHCRLELVGPEEGLALPHSLLHQVDFFFLERELEDDVELFQIELGQILRRKHGGFTCFILFFAGFWPASASSDTGAPCLFHPEGSK